MKKVIRKIIGAMHISKQTADGRDLIDASESESSINAFYQRMFDRDVYLHVSEISDKLPNIIRKKVTIA
jgi:hypothetical protein